MADTMSSYLSNLLTHTTSRYNSIKRTLLSNEDDGDTEDDSHITRVLRAYYTEKGRPFPPWLPPDPNERQATTPQPSIQSRAGSYLSNVSTRTQYSSVQNQAGQRSSLNDLWDPPAAQPSAPLQPQSLRNARRPAPAAQPTSTPTNNLAPRPLPSQRAGSYQTMQAQQSSRPSYDPTPPGSSNSGTAQDRLKARLWGNGGSRGGSPANSNAYQPPSSGSNPYGTYGRPG